MKKQRKLVKVSSGIIFCLTLILLFAPSGYTQEAFPSKPIISVIPFSAGGSTDLACRALGTVAPKYLGQPLIPLNKPGAVGTMAGIFTAREKSDGYTIAHLSTGALCTVPLVFDTAFEPSSLKPVLGWSEFPFFIIVRADAPWKNLDEFVNYVRSNPGLKYTHSGPGSFPHLAMEAFAKAAKIKITGVPFKGDTDQITALLGGHATVSCFTSGAKPLVDSGSLRILVMFNKERVEGYKVPTVKELGYDLGLYSPFLGAFVHKDTTDPIVKKLHDSLKKAIEDQEFIEAMDKVGMPIRYVSIDNMRERIKIETETSRVLIKELGLLKKPKE